MPLTLGRFRRACRSHGALAFALIVGLAPLQDAGAQAAKKIPGPALAPRTRALPGEGPAAVREQGASGLATAVSPLGMPVPMPGRLLRQPISLPE